jgi:catechol 2,3-dioxygenase-like lactoylglutathione lyase family enzyme
LEAGQGFDVNDDARRDIRTGSVSGQSCGKCTAEVELQVSVFWRKGSRLMARPMIESMCPFFIVSHVPRAIAFYVEQLGFEIRYREPEEEPFFAIVGRDRASLFIKAGEVPPLPNPKRDAAMRWDAYCYTPDPDGLAAEFTGHGTPFSSPLKDTEDGLRGFEITDPDGYVIFFGRPREIP